MTDDIPRAGASGRALLDALATAQHMPAEAIEQALRHPERIAEPVLAQVRRAAAGEALDERAANLVFWGIHVLGASGDTRLFGPLVALMRRGDDATLDLLGDALTGTAARILVSTYDGQPDPLLAALGDREADGYARWCLFGALAYLTATGAVARDATDALLRRFDDERLAPGGDPAWIGWEEAVALGGFADLAPRVEAARQDARLLDDVSDPEWFVATLAEAVDAPDARTRFDDKGLGPVEDVLAELEEALDTGDEPEAEAPVTNPLRHVGRNDPCPCGSGRKFKKCCLAA